MPNESLNTSEIFQWNRIRSVPGWSFRLKPRFSEAASFPSLAYERPIMLRYGSVNLRGVSRMLLGIFNPQPCCLSKTSSWGRRLMPSPLHFTSFFLFFFFSFFSPLSLTHSLYRTLSLTLAKMDFVSFFISRTFPFLV